MKRIVISICFFLGLVMSSGCSVIKQKKTINHQQDNIDNSMSMDLEFHDNNDHMSNTVEIGQNINDNNMSMKFQGNNDHMFVSDEIIQKNITEFFFVEIMNENTDLSFHRDEHGKYRVIDLFGEPLDIRVTNTSALSLNIAGGKVIEIRELIYDDFVHIYYVFENNITFYIGFNIEKRLERLKTINIGDTSDKLLSTFSDKYYPWKGNFSYYTDPVTCEIQFIIEEMLIHRIFVCFFLN